MPAVSAVPVTLAVRVLKKYITHFTTDKLPQHSSPVWKSIANDMEIQGLWTVDAVRINVRQDRRKILTLAREECGIFIHNKEGISHKLNDSTHDRDDVDTTYDLDDNEKDDDGDIKDFDSNECDDDDERENFDVLITREQWNEMKRDEPLICNGRRYPGFKPGVWTNIVSFAFWEQYRLKCAFVFKRGKIHESGSNYAVMIGRCRDRTCQNPLFGIIKNPPGDEGPVFITMKCRDTRFSKHADVKRPLNGKKRNGVQERLLRTGVLAWRKEEAEKILKPGDTGSPFLYDSSTLHQAKKEASDKELGIKPDDRRDVILTIRKMNEDPCFANSILAIGDTPFYVFYATLTQFHTYAEYLRIYRKYSSICIDATGGLVKKLTDSRDKKTGYIFLYQVVINFKGTSISVYQMLSETHDAKFISFWLSRWVQKVNPPREAVSDGSKALLNAMSDSFNGKSLKEYINFCFENLIGNTNLEPRTFIRLDTAHFIHSVSRWECFQSVLHKIVKSFYLYCTALMIDCKRLSQLEGIFILTLIVSGTEFEDSIISVSNDCIITPVEARNQLEKFISIRNPDLTVIDSIEINTEKTMIFDQSSCGVDKNGWSLALLAWIDNLCKKANTIIFTGSKLNSFYMPKLYVRLVEIIKEFPLWTNVCTPDTMPRATSSHIEADFKDLKMNLKKKVKLPTTEIKFLKLHIVDLLGGVNIFRSKLTKFVVDNCSEEELNKPKDENLFENWKGLGKDENSNDYDWIDDYVNSSMDKDDQRDSVSPLKDKDGLNYSVNLSESHIDHNYSANYLEEKNDANKIINISSTIRENDNSLTAISSRNRYDEDIIAAAHTGDDNDTLITLLSKDLHDQDSIITSDAAEDVNNNLNMLLSKNHHKQDISIATTDAGDANNSLNILLSKSYHHRNDVIKLRNPNNLSKVIENDNKKNTPELLTMKQHSEPLSAAVEAMVQQKSINKEVGLYFQNFPEIKLRNNLVDVKQTKIFLLGNGNKSGPVVFNGKKWTALNTCPFDTIIQLIFVGALDSTRFHKYITNLDIPVFKFLNDFMKKGPTKEIYQQRMSILHPIYNVSIVDKKKLEEKDMMKIDVSPTINCYDNISKLWQTLFKNAPSVIETSFCSNSSCQVQTQAFPVLTVNHKTIDRCGFIALEKALSFYNKIFNVQCRFCNKAKATRVTVPKEYLFLELDIRGNINASSGKRCKLSQFPTHLNLKVTDNGSETTLRYRLSGVAAYRTGHYFAYCRRLSGSWQIYNDSSAKPESAALSTEVEPHGVFYILE